MRRIADLGIFGPKDDSITTTATTGEDNGIQEWKSSATPHTAPNHILINHYKPGEGIHPHEDGPAYAPVTATVSLGAHTVLDVYEKRAEGEGEVRAETEAEDGDGDGSGDGPGDGDENDKRTHPQRWRILQEPRSLLLTLPPAYGDTLHGIQSVEVDYDLHAGSVANWDLLDEGTRAAVRNEEDGGPGALRRGERVSLTCRDVLKVSKLGGRVGGFLGRGRG